MQNFKISVIEMNYRQNHSICVKNTFLAIALPQDITYSTKAKSKIISKYFQANAEYHYRPLAGYPHLESHGAYSDIIVHRHF